LDVPPLEALSVVIADKASIRRGVEPATRDRVHPPFGPTVIEASSLFEALSTAVYPAVAVTVALSPVLSDGA